MGELNKYQKSAVVQTKGIELVIAGAGTGKTYTIIQKIKNIINHGFRSEKIVVLTFSRNAAGELHERIRREIGNKSETVYSGTFHSFGLKIMREYGNYLPARFNSSSFPVIIDGPEKNQCIKNIVKSLREDFYGIPDDVVCYFIEHRRALPEKIVNKLAKNGILVFIDFVIDQFQKYKTKQNCIDFNDVLTIVIEMLHNNPEFVRILQKRFQYFIIDEFQDCSALNVELLKAVINRQSTNLFMVGDDWQSIYAFRNADVQYMINIDRIFKNVRIHKLVINYRSRKEIITVSGRILKRNKRKIKKKVISKRGKGGVVSYLIAKNIKEEVAKLKTILQSGITSEGMTAILYRNNYYGKYLESCFPELVENSSVVLSTIHGVKGLEYKTVVIMGVSDRILPSKLADLEEERRLFYVAMTRAVDRLYIIFNCEDGDELPRFARELGIKK